MQQLAIQEVDLKNLYSNVLAGRLPLGTADPTEVLVNHAYALLGSKKLHIHFQEFEGYLYYLAVESKWMSSLIGLPIPFTRVFPGGPDHQGDGIYRLEANSYIAALVVEGGSLRLLCNTPEVLQDYLLGIGLPTIDLNPESGESLTSIYEGIQGLSSKAARYLMRASMGLLLLASTAFVGVHAAQAMKDSDEELNLTIKTVEDDLNKELDKLNIQQPLARQIARIQKVSATVVRAGGWIETYTLKDEKKETFELVLPSWVSPDYVDSLGQDVVTDLRDLEGLLTVRKKAKEK